MGKQYISVSFQLDIETAKDLAVIAGLPEHAYFSVNFASLIQSVIAQHVRTEFSEKVAPSGHCEACDSFTEEAWLMLNFAGNEQTLLCESCAARGLLHAQRKGKQKIPPTKRPPIVCSEMEEITQADIARAREKLSAWFKAGGETNGEAS